MLWLLAGGNTHYQRETLTSFGNRVGRKNTILLVTAAGHLCSMVTSLSMIAIAHFQRKKCPHLSFSLNIAAIMSITTHVEYALSALKKEDSESHDFSTLAQAGFHPLALTVGMISLPLLLKALSVIYLD